METQNNFAAQVAASEKAQAHAQEIQQSRVGGLGGSDAAMILKIGQSGLAALTATDHKRLCVMLGKTDPDAWSGNVYTNAGHAFEDWAEKVIIFGNNGYEREKVLEKPLARNFKVFAHADFVEFVELGEVVTECKFSQNPTERVVNQYWAQLQWYYMLGAKNVILFHGTGTADPFEVEETRVETIKRSQDTIEMLLAGIKTLDEALSEGWLPDVIDKVTTDETPEIIQKAFEAMQSIKEQQKTLAEAEKIAKNTLLEYLEAFDLSGIVATDGSKHQIIYTRASVSRSFDIEKFAKAHPEIDLAPFYKETKRASSLTFK